MVAAVGLRAIRIDYQRAAQEVDIAGYLLIFEYFSRAEDKGGSRSADEVFIPRGKLQVFCGLNILDRDQVAHAEVHAHAVGDGQDDDQ